MIEAPMCFAGFYNTFFNMADKVDSEKRKKHKKKHKKATKSSTEEQESAAFESADTNASQNEKTATPEQSPVAPKESKVSPEKMAPKPQSSNRQWSHDQEETLLKNVKKYTLKLSGKQQYSQRVDWSKVQQMDDFTQFEMQEQYKMLTKKVRKSRSVLEIVEDAVTLHKENRHKEGMRLLSKNRKFSKQPPNAFSIFCKAKRASLVEKHPELKFSEIHKKLCERWKELAEDKREKYVSKAEKAKLEYYEEVKKFHDQQISMIKKPMSAYTLWKSERLQDEDIDGDETENDFVVEWENLPKSTKKGWLQAASSEKEKYDLEVVNITGTSGQAGKIAKDKKAKDKKSVAETQIKVESASDEQQQSSSSPKNSGLKRKQNSSGQAAKSPEKKVKIEEPSNSENSESSSDED